MDEHPAWARDGNTLYYVGESFPGLPPGRGLLLALPRHGGTASLLLPALQGAAAAGPRWLAAPAPSPDGQRVAYLEMAEVAEPGTVVSEQLCEHAEPLLDSLVLRVRKLVDTGPLLNDPAVALPLQGRSPGQRTGGAGPFTLRTFPFQRRFAEDRRLVLRPAWSPDGTRIVFTDGLRLLIWAVNSGPPVEIPATADAVSPAWSPDGQWIAYARLERSDSSVSSCAVGTPRLAIQHNRIGYGERRPIIVLTRADGSSTRVLAEGEEPAWSPDSRFIYLVRDSRIWSAPIDGGAAVEIPGTQSGSSPAVSPDGGRLVFVRLRNDPLQFDLWSVPLLR
jgi:Tol biopolymer transport system component